jgi:hypothetical protein
LSFSGIAPEADIRLYAAAPAILNELRELRAAVVAMREVYLTHFDGLGRYRHDVPVDLSEPEAAAFGRLRMLAAVKGEPK